MSRAERKIEAAKKRVRNAEVRLSKAYEAKRVAVARASEKTNPAIWKASRAVQEARQQQAIAELEAIGITPMQTIILYRPRYSGITEQRYVVRVTREGWKKLVPVSKKGRLMKGRAEQNPPMDWSKVTVTGEVFED